MRLLIVLLKIRLFPKVNFLTMANSKQKEELPRLLVGSLYQDGNLADLTNYFTLAVNR